MWWVATTCGWRASGESHSAAPEPGSSANTSRPARTRPASSAASSAASSTTSPREVFTRIAPGFIAARNSASTRFLVSGDAGTCRLTTSDGGEQLRAAMAKPTASSSASRSRVAWLRPARSRQPIRIPNAGRPLGHGEADRAQADDAQGAAEQPVGLAVGRLLPTAPARVGDVVGDPAVQGQDQARGSAPRRRPRCGRARCRPAPRCGPRPRCRWCWCPRRPGSPARACPPPRTPRGRPWCCAPPARRRRRSDPAGPRWSARAPPNSDVPAR